MPKAIFIVTDGSYSDYHIEAVFDDKGLALQYVEFFGGDIEEYEPNKMGRQLREGLKPYKVSMKKDGTVTQCHLNGSDSDYQNEDEDGRTFIDYQKTMQAAMFATDETHAIKIANERRANLIATNQWS